MNYIKRSKQYKKTNNVSEAVVQIDDTYKVGGVNVPQSLINSYVKKVKDETGKDLRHMFSDMDIASELVKFTTDKYLVTDELPITALLGGEVEEEQVDEEDFDNDVESEDVTDEDSDEVDTDTEEQEESDEVVDADDADDADEVEEDGLEDGDLDTDTEEGSDDDEFEEATDTDETEEDEDEAGSDETEEDTDEDEDLPV